MNGKKLGLLAVLGLLALIGAWFLLGPGGADTVDEVAGTPDRKRTVFQPVPTEQVRPAAVSERNLPLPTPSTPGVDEPELAHQVDPVVTPPDMDGVELTVWPTSRDGIRGAMEEVGPAIKQCYEDALAEIPDLEGRIAATMTLVEREGIGHISAVDVESSTVDDGLLEECVLGAMAALQFDAPDGEVVVTWPFVFRALEDEP